MSSKIKLLFFAAQPIDSEHLRLGEEVRAIEQKLLAAPKSRSFDLISQWAVRPQDLSGALLRYQPTIVHFSGHGIRDRLVFEDEKGYMKPIEGRHIASLLAAFSHTIRLVFFNACFSAESFGELSQAIDYTVGTTSGLFDSAAIQFSSCFYQSLGFGHSVPMSFELAKRQINLEEPDMVDAFTLLVREGINPDEPFVRPRPSRLNKAAPYKGQVVTRLPLPPKGAEAREQGFSGNQAAGTLGVSVRHGNPQADYISSSSSRVPAELKESLERFKLDHPDPQRVAFLMMRFGKTKAHDDIVAGIRMALDQLGITVVRADDKQYHDDLLPNVLTYVYGSGLGIAVFERIESEAFNPNVALEVGYMLALGKKVCLLKDRTLSSLHVDLVGKLYRVFDPLNPLATIPEELLRWLSDKGFK